MKRKYVKSEKQNKKQQRKMSRNFSLKQKENKKNE